MNNSRDQAGILRAAIAWAIVVLCFALPAAGQAKAKITGPEATAPGDLVVLSSHGSIGRAFEWRLIGSRKSFLAVNDNREAVFSSGTPGVYHFTLSVADAVEGAVSIDVAIFDVVIGSPPIDPVDPVEPTDPVKPVPIDADLKPLADVVGGGAARIDDPDRASQARAIATAFADHAKRVAEFDSVKDLSRSTSEQYRAELGVAGYLPWRINVFEPLAKELEKLNAKGLTTPADFGPAWAVIADAFQGVADAK